jgi:hypothetical protein
LRGGAGSVHGNNARFQLSTFEFHYFIASLLPFVFVYNEGLGRSLDKPWKHSSTTRS